MANRPWAWALLIALVPLFGFWTYGLFDLDEGFYAAVVSEMNRRGDWITPYYNGQPWFEKPILLYWLAAPSIAAFGEAVGPRLPGVLATFALHFFCGSYMARRYGADAARWTVLILGSSLLVVAVGRMMMTDSLLNLTLSACLILFFQSTVGAKRLRMASAACLGLAVLAKGPVAAILFVLIAGLAYWRLPDVRVGFRGFWVPSVLIFFVVIASWYVPCYLANGDLFVQRFLIDQNIGRFTGGDAAHSVGFFKGLPIYPITLVVGMAPWVFFLRSAWTSVADPFGRFMQIWFLVIFVFFLISGAKLPHYILPAATPLALLIARSMSRSLVTGYVSVAAVFLVAQLGFSFYYNQGHAEVHRLVRAIRGSALPVVVYQMPRREKDLGTGSLHIRETSHPSLIFYLNRTVVELDTEDQLREAIAQSPSGLWVLTRKNRLDKLPGGEPRFEPWQDYGCWYVR